MDTVPGLDEPDGQREQQRRVGNTTTSTRSTVEQASNERARRPNRTRGGRSRLAAEWQTTLLCFPGKAHDQTTDSANQGSTVHTATGTRRVASTAWAAAAVASSWDPTGRHRPWSQSVGISSSTLATKRPFDPNRTGLGVGRRLPGGERAQ